MIKDNIIKFIKDNYVKLIKYVILILIIVCVGLIINSIITTYKNNKISIEYDNGKKANYKSDMNFLECIGEQHTCVYKNIDSGKDIIIKNCKEENFCNETYNNSINVNSN